MRIKFSIILMLMIAGCLPYNPYAHEFTTQKPKKEQITGVYVLIYQNMQEYAPSLEKDLKKMHSPPSITISADNSFSFHQVPTFDDEKDVMHPKFSGFSDATGTWSITVVGGVGDRSGKSSEDHWGVDLTSLKGRMGCPGFMGNPTPDSLIFTFADPDSGQVLIFKKQ